VAWRIAVLRLLLLVVTAIGVMGMHMLGHPSSQGHGFVGHTTVLVDQESTMGVLDVAMVAAAYGDMDGTGTGMDPFNVCMAISWAAFWCYWWRCHWRNAVAERQMTTPGRRSL
jgi:hypothetical protein